MDLNKIAAAALESLEGNMRDDLRGKLEKIRKKRDVLEKALGRAREQVLKALPRELRAEFAKEDVAFLFFIKIEDDAPDFAHFITDDVSKAVEKLIDCEKILEAFDDEDSSDTAPLLKDRSAALVDVEPSPAAPAAAVAEPAAVDQPPPAVDDASSIERAILTELRERGSLSNISAFAKENDFTHTACYIVLLRLCAQDVIHKIGRGLNVSYLLIDSAPRPIAAPPAAGAARQPAVWRYERAGRSGSADSPFVDEFLKEVGKGNISAARALYEHDSMRQGALNSAALRYIGMRLDWLASNASAGEDDIRGQCRAMRHAANAILKTENSEYGMPLRRLQEILSGRIAGLPDTMRQKVLAELRDIFSAAQPTPPAPAVSRKTPRPAPAPARGPTEDEMRDRVANFVYDLRFEDARRVNTDKEHFRQGVLMAVTRHLELVAGTDEASNEHLQSVGNILNKTRQYIPPEMTKTALEAAFAIMKAQKDRYPDKIIFKIKYYLRQYL